MLQIQHLAVTSPEGHYHKMGVGSYGEILARLKDEDPVWSRPDVWVYQTYLFDEQEAKCCPSGDLVGWFGDDPMAEWGRDEEIVDGEKQTEAAQATSWLLNGRPQEETQ